MLKDNTRRRCISSGGNIDRKENDRAGEADANITLACFQEQEQQAPCAERMCSRARGEKRGTRKASN